MVELIPVMLFILGWHPDKPGEIDLQRPEILYASVEECERWGAKMGARMTLAASDKSGATYEHRCMPIPSQTEFEDLFDNLEKRGE